MGMLLVRVAEELALASRARRRRLCAHAGSRGLGGRLMSFAVRRRFISISLFLSRSFSYARPRCINSPHGHGADFWHHAGDRAAAFSRARPDGPPEVSHD